MAQNETITTTELTYTIVLEPDEEDGGYTVTCPALPGLVTHGDTVEEARAMAADAIQGYLESLRKDGVAFPVSEEPSAASRREAVTVKLSTA
jgi:predicted RNase H-like HicB family nuclease